VQSPHLAAQHVGDLHEMVIDHHGQMVCRKPVCLQEDLVVNRAVVKRDRAVHHIVNSCLPAGNLQQCVAKGAEQGT
jgi:hypothetical protein